VKHRPLHEDDDLVAVAKPAGVTVIPARNEAPEMALHHQLEAERGERLWVVHRLDRDTSGVVLFARNAAAHRALSMAFEARAVKKSYIAWTRGAPAADHGVITTPLHTARKGKMRPAVSGETDALPSATSYRVSVPVATTRLGPVARVELEPHTGRQHQIRVHMRSIGTPLLVDPLYAGCDAIAPDELGEASPPIVRLTLHAERIEFTHPTTEQRITIDAPLPSDLASLDAWLASRASAY
jgi:tRNA pseudouridine32 synthase/23S rRNA pseudouridine746 synthase